MTRLGEFLWLFLLACCCCSTTHSYSVLSNTPVVIAPGFLNDARDYQDSLVTALVKRGFAPDLIDVVPMHRSDWFRVAQGLFDGNTYRGVRTATGQATDPDIAYGWYLQRLRDAIDEAYIKSGGERVVILAHSAGGWLARAALGGGLWRPNENEILLPNKRRYTADRVAGLATLGGLHHPPVNAFPFFTRGAVAFTNQAYPGAFLKKEGVGYVSVGSSAIAGCHKSQKTAFTSYQLVCGKGNVVGDGVIPLEWTQLEGARHIPLEGTILHSFSPTGDNRPWYGTDDVMDQWLSAALEEAGILSKEELKLD